MQRLIPLIYCLLVEPAGESPDRSLKDYTRDCLRSGCHAGLKDAPWIHGPVAVGACDACHLADGDAKAHKFRHARPPETFCEFCHRPPAERAVSHRPYAEHNCVACHDPHGAKSKSLLVAASLPALCAKCHDRAPEPAGSKSAPGGNGGNGGNGAPGGKKAEPLPKISTLHDELAAGGTRHGPVAKGECGACHQPHASAFAKLLTGSYPAELYADYAEGAYDFCFRCHDARLLAEDGSAKTRFRDGARNLHAVHVRRQKGRTCSVCHPAHGTAEGRLVRKDVPFGPGGWRLPIAFVATAAGGTCETGCHKKMAYDHSK